MYWECYIYAWHQPVVAGNSRPLPNQWSKCSKGWPYPLLQHFQCTLLQTIPQGPTLSKSKREKPFTLVQSLYAHHRGVVIEISSPSSLVTLNQFCGQLPSNWDWCLPACGEKGKGQAWCQLTFACDRVCLFEVNQVPGPSPKAIMSREQQHLPTPKAFCPCSESKFTPHHGGYSAAR